jgi:ribulose 1,5-bisphosphate carboxylase large subunit-like protein
MHGAFNRDKGNGICMLAVCKPVRMTGGTNLHTGIYMGKWRAKRMKTIFVMMPCESGAMATSACFR